MTVKTSLIVTALSLALYSCDKKQTAVPIVGTWKLVSATATEKDSTFSTFNPKGSMIKIINATHFAFLNRSLTNRDDSTTAFTAGGGSYTLVDSLYTEQLDYFVDKEWENHTFAFVVNITGDTLTQRGTEKVAKLGIDRIIVEKYKRVGN